MEKNGCDGKHYTTKRRINLDILKYETITIETITIGGKKLIMMKKLASTFALGLFLLIGLATVASAQTYETEVKWGVNFRAAPSTDSYVFRMIPKGEKIHVIEQHNSYWLKIQVQDGTIGFISSNSKYTNWSPSSNSGKTLVTTGYPWFRSAPSTNSTIYRSIPKGTALRALSSETNGYVKVSYGGREGWIHKNYFRYTSSGSPSTPPASGSKPSWERKADAIIATAKSYIGKVTYKYGTRNPSKLIFDCSSFTQYVFQKHGVSMKWGTRYQKNMGSYVSKSNLRKGDLVFFDTNGNGSINHVGIYIGNNQFIENGPTAGVRISNLNSNYWSKAYKTARRVL